MPKIFQLIILLGITCSYSYAFRFPTKDALEKCFLRRGIDPHFLEKTHISEELSGDKNLVPLGVNLKLELLFIDYMNNLKEGGLPENQLRMMYFLIRNTKSVLLECVFQEHPEELKELKETLAERDLE